VLVLEIIDLRFGAFKECGNSYYAKYNSIISSIFVMFDIMSDTII